MSREKALALGLSVFIALGAGGCEMVKPSYSVSDSISPGGESESESNSKNSSEISSGVISNSGSASESSSPASSSNPEVTITPIPTEIVPPTPTPEKKIDLSRVVYTGNPNKKDIAVTFDDSGKGLHEILNICNEKGIKATFFLLAGELSAFPAIWQQAIKDGHQICSHGICHRMDLGKLSEEEIKNDILGWEKVCKATLGEEYFNKMKNDFPYFRVPGGNYTDRIRKVLAELGYTTVVQWNAEDCWSMEPANNPNKLTLVQNYMIRLKNGAIFLAHGGSAGSVAEIIDGVKEKGYNLKLVSEILD